MHNIVFASSLVSLVVLFMPLYPCALCLIASFNMLMLSGNLVCKYLHNLKSPNYVVVTPDSLLQASHVTFSLSNMLGYSIQVLM